MEVFGRHHGDLGNLARAVEVRFELLDTRVGRRDRGVGVAVDGAVGVELVADEAFGAERNHLRGLVFQGLRMLEAAELAPARVELAGMAHVVEAEEGRVAGARRKMVVAPAAGGQALDLQMRIGIEAPRPLLMDVAAIVEDADARKLGAERCAHLAAETLVDPFVILEPVGRLLRIEAHLGHRGEAGGANAVGRQDDVEEQPGRVVAFEDFARLFQKLLAVSFVIEAQRVPRRAQLLGARRILGQRMLEGVAGAQHPPLGMEARVALVPLDGDIDRGFDVGGLQRRDHVAKEIGPGQVRVRRADFGRVV